MNIKYCQQLTLKKAKYFQKKAVSKQKNKKSLIPRVHDIIGHLPDFAAHQANRPRNQSICELEQFLSGILQLLKKMNAFCIIIELYLQKNG